ncbi:MAG: type II toxin-antitoxin system mRNA interferase toxin, RelE/StbE family [Bacteroidetes bacterium]|uniref:Type II toxin-antitoxin system mRNA interferase toxin, RelE/StbE family n=1 Tax=Candidatus Cryptobacteroides excrementavium TaxID=2840759 RepID=A0A9D9J588_9BACT|nr:type II toxin-antitoxin system mRNA interferase toxin, RelE/StbE family [Candidatus Cryptobacteroides excrementavium]
MYRHSLDILGLIPDKSIILLRLGTANRFAILSASAYICHIRPDWLLIYSKESDGELHILNLLRTGTHSDLFKK